MNNREHETDKNIIAMEKVEELLAEVNELSNEIEARLLAARLIVADTGIGQETRLAERAKQELSWEQESYVALKAAQSKAEKHLKSMRKQVKQFDGHAYNALKN